MRNDIFWDQSHRLFSWPGKLCFEVSTPSLTLLVLFFRVRRKEQILSGCGCLNGFCKSNVITFEAAVTSLLSLPPPPHSGTRTARHLNLSLLPIVLSIMSVLQWQMVNCPSCQSCNDKWCIVHHVTPAVTESILSIMSVLSDRWYIVRYVSPAVTNGISFIMSVLRWQSILSIMSVLQWQMVYIVNHLSPAQTERILFIMSVLQWQSVYCPTCQSCNDRENIVHYVSPTMTDGVLPIMSVLQWQMV